MQKLITKYAILSLIVIAIICGFLWRVELEHHGWAGLGWISYFHWAVPIGFALFLLWGNLFISLVIQKRILINALAVICGILLYNGLKFSLTTSYSKGLVLFSSDDWRKVILFALPYLFILFIPIGAYLTLKVFKCHPPIKFVIISMIGMILSIPISVVILYLFDHKGGSDFIHSIKSGILIPFWIISIGILIIGQRKKISANE